MRNEIEDGFGFYDLVESSKERRERESFARIWEEARLRGRLEAFAEAMTECTKAERRDNGGIGGRDCSEIRKAIDILHLNTLYKIKEMMPYVNNVMPNATKLTGAPHNERNERDER